MFVAIDQFGNKVNPLDTAEEELRMLSKSKMLFCPECNTVVRFASGEQVMAHFKHVHSPDCVYDSEPESEEHLKGKMLIRNWLVNRYPDVHVEFENKIKETNQRADVMAIFPEGERIAFEMQCSKIQGSVWKERHALYKQAGIKDFWILGGSVHKYGKTNWEEDKDKHQLVSLASAIYEKEDAVLFLDTEMENLRGLYKHKYKGWHSDTILMFDEEIYPLEEAEIFKNFIGTKSIKNEFKVWYLEKKRKDQEEKEKQEQYRREQERREKEQAEIVKLRETRIKEHLSELNSMTLENVKGNMTKNERELFESLLRKHKFNDDNFPGIFNVYVPGSILIYTPPQLWQLWLYDKYIHRKLKTNYDKVWVPNVKNDFYKMKEKGIFRFKYQSGDIHYSFAIYDYIDRLGSMDIVNQLGYQTTKYHEICYDVLPPLTGKEVQNYIAYYLSTNHEPLFEETELRNEIVEAVILYKTMIREYREERPQINEKALSTLEYTNNLLKSMPELGNDWERAFISKMFGLQRSGYELTEKQQYRVKAIVKQVENKLGVSLAFTGSDA